MLSEPNLSYKPFWGICRPLNSWRANSPNPIQIYCARKSAVEDEIKSLQKTLSLLEFKCWYYKTAMEDGTEEHIQAMLPDKLPNDIQKLYDASHK